jgi:hypothetical protein|tara:strand:+ start:148 stop:324 length:177 start_codon:yes stop_codon:yes gene_type:complete
MSEMNQKHNGSKLAWAVLSKNSNPNKAEVIKITDYIDADRTVQNDPGLYYKSGPFLLT